MRDARCTNDWAGSSLCNVTAVGRPDGEKGVAAMTCLLDLVVGHEETLQLGQAGEGAELELADAVGGDVEEAQSGLLQEGVRLNLVCG